MNYKIHYDKLIFNARNRICDDSVYYEIHHIIPKCLGGDDTENNLIKLTAREHYIAHALLAKLYSGTSFGYKLAAAFNFMCLDSHNGERSLNSKCYELARILFSKNHPTKSEHVRLKISLSLKKYYSSYQYKMDKLSRKPYKVRLRAKQINVLRECECGCKENFECSINSKQRFIVNHSQKILNKDKTLIDRKKCSLKQTLNSMSPQEMANRMANSVGTADPIKRGLSISKSKKGKKTNQNILEIIKYGSMDDVEFERFLLTKSPKVHLRIRNKRQKYYDNKLYYDNYRTV